MHWHGWCHILVLVLVLVLILVLILFFVRPCRCCPPCHCHLWVVGVSVVGWDRVRHGGCEKSHRRVTTVTPMITKLTHV